MHYVNTTLGSSGNSLLEKGKYFVIESSYLNISTYCLLQFYLQIIYIYIYIYIYNFFRDMNIIYKTVFIKIYV